ncbi:MAG TPA: regulator [Bacteroidales bacterium]|nr:MAG: regulator [Bacteroidetes bacterium GWE2_42_24]OFY32622.1 MAG: regulator [Bacteroidetes bacterium GWF2_43_11]HAQ65208.1 regulator [Bacteroidales bacterium]HBZ65546.1 regulator [Bacteroidales bacterium]
MQAPKVFLVEDDLITAKALTESLIKETGCEVSHFGTGRDFLEAITHQQPDLVSLDYLLPDSSGAELFKKVKKMYPDIPVIMVSGQQDISTAVDLLRQGAYDYIVKDKNMRSRLVNLVLKIGENIQLHRKITELEKEVGRKYIDYNPIKGNSAAIQRIFELIEKAARINIVVSITGETGTGKELVAKAIHYNSYRKKGKFVAINVSAIPSELIESELFGHEKGSFTGAMSRRIGKFEEAAGGTLFLDEIGDMDINMQTKLLRALQEEEVTRVGGNDVIKTDVRVIVATNKNLAEEAHKGTFRKDLYYRLLGLPIELPPLRDRADDILVLARFFADEFCKKNNIIPLDINNKAQEKLLQYSYPGNVRELKAVVELACVMATGSTIQPENFTFTSNIKRDDFLMHEKTLDDYNLEIVNHYMEKYNQNIKKVAEKLGIGKTTVYRMLKKQPGENDPHS